MKSDEMNGIKLGGKFWYGDQRYVITQIDIGHGYICITGGAEATWDELRQKYNDELPEEEE